jgi:hypothetical protein
VSVGHYGLLEEKTDISSEAVYVPFSLILSFFVGYFAMLLVTKLQNVG